MMAKKLGIGRNNEHERKTATINGFAGALKAMGKSEADVLALLAEARAAARDGRHDGARTLFARMRDIEVREALVFNGRVHNRTIAGTGVIVDDMEGLAR